MSTDRDDSVGCNRACDPLVARATQNGCRVQGQVGGEVPSTEAFEWGCHAHLLVGPARVVVVHPLVELVLEILERAEGAFGDELSTKCVVPALNFAGRRWAAWLSEDVFDPILATDLVKEHLGVVVSEPASEDLAVVREDLLGHAPTGEGRHEVLTDRT